MQPEYKGQPYCCAECCYARFLKFPEPLCIVTNKTFTHNTAKSKADWCPIKDGKTIDDFKK